MWGWGTQCVTEFLVHGAPPVRWSLWQCLWMPFCIEAGANSVTHHSEYSASNWLDLDFSQPTVPLSTSIFSQQQYLWCATDNSHHPHTQSPQAMYVFVNSLGELCEHCQQGLQVSHWLMWIKTVHNLLPAQADARRNQFQVEAGFPDPASWNASG